MSCAYGCAARKLPSTRAHTVLKKEGVEPPASLTFFSKRLNTATRSTSRLPKLLSEAVDLRPARQCCKVGAGVIGRNVSRRSPGWRALKDLRPRRRDRSECALKGMRYRSQPVTVMLSTEWRCVLRQHKRDQSVLSKGGAMVDKGGTRRCKATIG